MSKTITATLIAAAFALPVSYALASRSTTAAATPRRANPCP